MFLWLNGSAGPTVGGLLNITFGSVAELTLALFVLATGHLAIVKAQITGSVVSTSLLGLGTAILVGGWKREKQTFSRERAGLLGSLLILSVIALLLPALFNYTERGLFAASRKDLRTLNENLSICVAIVLIYLANLIYVLVTHRDVFASRKREVEPAESLWPIWQSLPVLCFATAAVATESDLIARSLEATAGQLGLTPLFLGVIVLALIGNAADIMAAIYFARQDRMDLVMGICQLDGPSGIAVGSPDFLFPGSTCQSRIYKPAGVDRDYRSRLCGEFDRQGWEDDLV